MKKKVFAHDGVTYKIGKAVDLSATKAVLKAAGFTKMSRKEVVEQEFSPEPAPFCKLYFDADDGGDGDEVEIMPDGNWTYTSSNGERVKYGAKVSDLKKVLAHRKANPDAYLYELAHVRHAFKRGYIDAYLFLPCDGRIIRVTPKTYEKAKKTFLYTSKHGNA